MAKAKKTRVETLGKASEKYDDGIIIRGARVHNLKNVTVTIPRDAFVVVTGVSGSGKSSLTIDTLFAEGQRRYAESLSAYARQFLMRMNKPDVDHIAGLSPAIAIEQKVVTRTPRSTVGSMTEIYDYMRLLYARVGRTVSPVSGREVRKDDIRDVVNTICGFPHQNRVYVLTPFPQKGRRDPKEELGLLLQKGFSRVYDHHAKGLSRIEDLQSTPGWKPGKGTFVLVDRLVVKDFDEDDIHRISDSVSTAFWEGEGELDLVVDEERMLHFSNRFELDGMKFEEPVPNLFSFNNPFGACPVCEGFSQVLGIDADLVIPDRSLSVYEGAVAPWKGEKLGKWKDRFVRDAQKNGFPVHRPVAELTKEQARELADILDKQVESLRLASKKEQGEPK